MNIRSIISTSFLLAGLVAASGCDMPLSELDGSDEFVTSEHALSSDLSNCVSNQPHITDRWCQAVACASVYVEAGYCVTVDNLGGRPCTLLDCGEGFIAEDTDADGCDDTCTPKVTKSFSDSGFVAPVEEEEVDAASDAHPFYPKWNKGTCAADGNAPSWQNNLYDNVSDCCETHFKWKFEACLTDARKLAAKADNNEVTSDLSTTSFMPVDEAPATDIDEDEPTTDTPATTSTTDTASTTSTTDTDEDEPTTDTPATTSTTDTDEEDDTSTDTPATTSTTTDVPATADTATDVEDDAPTTDAFETNSDEAGDVEPGTNDDLDGSASSCPEGWEYEEKDCSYLPWENSVAWNCNQQLVPSTTAVCGDHDEDAEFCLVPHHDTAGDFGQGGGVGSSSQWCVNPDYEAPAVCQNVIYCGMGMICGCAD